MSAPALHANPPPRGHRLQLGRRCLAGGSRLVDERRGGADAYPSELTGREPHAALGH